LCLPPYQSLTEGHCLIVPTSHVTCGTMLDEDVWEEMQVGLKFKIAGCTLLPKNNKQIFRKAVTKMFLSKDEDVIFFESARTLRGFPHMVMECVPVDKDSGALAPIYFKASSLPF
jgi:Protein similar to CwfJ C-terminus 1